MTDRHHGNGRPRPAAARHARRRVAAVAVVTALLATACSGATSDGDDADASGVDGDTAPPVVTGPPATFATLPPVTLPECSVPAAVESVPFAYGVPSSVVVTAYTVDDRRYSVVGVTNDPEATLLDVTARSFAGFESGEPSGGARDVVVEYASALGTATLVMGDGDADGCWDVEMIAEYAVTPVTSLPTGDTDDTAADEGAGDTDQPIVTNPVGDIAGVGQGQITTGRGTFTFTVTVCTADPLTVVGIAPEGDLSIAPEDGVLVVRWLHADGVEIVDDEPNVLQVDPTSGTVIAEGDGPDGPESLIIEYSCQ